MTTRTPEQTRFTIQISTVSNDLADWAEKQFDAGRSIESVQEQLRRVMRVVTPLRKAVEPIHENVTRSETEINLGWAEANPELFVQSVKGFQAKAPITHWRHFVDLSREHYIKLIAVRRDQPFDSVTDYVMEEKLYLRESGYDV